MGPLLEDSVNNTTATTAPQTPVKLIGVTLFELFEFMAVAPMNTNIQLAKIDLSDGFWHMIVKPKHRYNFCYVLLQRQGEPTHVVLPPALQMGWQQSPAFFCTATETGRDVIDWLIDSGASVPSHPF